MSLAPPLRSPARDLDARVGRALGLTPRETIAGVSPTSNLPAGTRVIVYEYEAEDGRWRPLPHYSTDAGLIPTLVDHLRGRVGYFTVRVMPDSVLVVVGSWARMATGATLPEALCRSVVALAEEEAAEEDER